MGSELPSEMVAAQQKSYVTFSTPFSDRIGTDEADAEPSITLLERRNLISGSQTTGFRTWEAALHLGSYLLAPAGQELIRGKSVLELGAGTGFLSILCAGQLQASHVTTTDGDEGVVDALKENLFLNDLDDTSKVLTNVLRWGHGLKGSWVQDDFEEHPYDTVIGADIVGILCATRLLHDADLLQTYDKIAISALVATLRMLFGLRPSVKIIVAGAVRNADTFETFRHTCSESPPYVTETSHANILTV